MTSSATMDKWDVVRASCTSRTVPQDCHPYGRQNSRPQKKKIREDKVVWKTAEPMWKRKQPWKHAGEMLFLGSQTRLNAMLNLSITSFKHAKVYLSNMAHQGQWGLLEGELQQASFQFKSNLNIAFEGTQGKYKQNGQTGLKLSEQCNWCVLCSEITQSSRAISNSPSDLAYFLYGTVMRL